MSRLEDALRRAELANRQAKMKTEAEAAVKTPAVAAWSEPEAVTAPFAAAWSEPESAAALPAVAAWSEPETVTAPLAAAAWSEPESAAVLPAVAAWSEPETVTAPFAVAGWSEPESAAAPPVVAAWSEPETVTAPLAVAAWSEPESAAAPPVVAGWSEPETVTAPFAVAGWSEPESATAPPAVAAWSEAVTAPFAVVASSEPETVTAPFVVAAPSGPENVQPPLPPLPTWDFDGSVAAAELVEAPDEPKVVTPSDWKTYRFGAVASRKTIVDPDVESSLVEQYRRLAASLHHAQLQRNVRTVMITSAVAAEGKTLTATNLALTLSHSYKRRVLLIDADLRRPTVHEAFRIANDTGLVDVLRKTETRRLPLCRASETLWILTAGMPTSDPMSALASEEMKLLLGEAIEHFDWVIVDSPPVALLSDANLVAAMVDATILVIGAATTPYPLVRRAVESVGASRIIGTVLNRIERGQMVGGYGFYDYYGYGTRDDGARKAGKADAAREAAMDAA